MDNSSRQEIEGAWQEYLQMTEVKALWETLPQADRQFFKASWRQGFLIGYGKGMKFAQAVMTSLVKVGRDHG